MFKLRDELNRMAPWNCTRKYTNLVYISSQPGTPENSAAASPFWVSGMPPPQWSYEYQYPVDCVRPRSIVPQYTSLAGGTPIYPLGTVTGFSPIGWSGPALKYEVASDQFFPVTAAAVAAQLHLHPRLIPKWRCAIRVLHHASRRTGDLNRNRNRRRWCSHFRFSR